MAVTVIGLLSTASGAAGGASPSADSWSRFDETRVPAPAKCSARKAVRFYSRRLSEHRARMGHPQPPSAPQAKAKGCPAYLASVLQRKARAWRKRAEAWVEYHFHWWKWLPANWRQVGACETGYGRQPGNWKWDSGSYVSAFGIYRAGYADDAHRIGNLSWDETLREFGRYPTPREQYEAALSHYRTHGDGWGCPGP